MQGGGRAATLVRRATVAGRPVPPGQAPGGSASAGSGSAGSVRAVVADEAELMHFAIRALLSTVPGYTMVACARSVGEAEQLVRRVRPDLLICDVDIAGESGIGLCRWVRQASPATCVAILTGRDEPLLAQSALAAGASGYLLKDSAPEDLAAYLGEVAGGMRVLDQRLGRSRRGEHRTDPTDEFGLSRREREVLGEVLAGLDNKRIAERLCISEDTVKSHVKAIFRKLGARDRAHAVALAVGTAALPGQLLYPAPHIPAARRAASR
jgi:DNA-binding NarL/FixJ family response regulator